MASKLTLKMPVITHCGEQGPRPTEKRGSAFPKVPSPLGTLTPGLGPVDYEGQLNNEFRP